MAEDERSVERTDDTDYESDGSADEGGAKSSADEGKAKSSADEGKAKSSADEGKAKSSADEETDPLERLGFDPDFESETDAFDDAAESFVRLEAELDGFEEAPAEGARGRGLVTGAERVDASAVPENYPLEIGSAKALALTLDFGRREATAYLDWPTDAEAESPLRYLLDATDSRLGDLYGEAVVVERTGDYYVVVTPAERPRSSGDWGLGVVGGHAVAAGLLALLAVAGLSLPVIGLWLLATLLWIPYATFSDAWYLRTHSDWDGGPLFWATLSALPALSLLVGAVYLRQRAHATFFGDQQSLRERVTRWVRSKL